MIKVNVFKVDQVLKSGRVYPSQLIKEALDRKTKNGSNLFVSIEDGNGSGARIANHCGIVRSTNIEGGNVTADIELWDFNIGTLIAKHGDASKIAYSLVGFGVVGESNIVASYDLHYVGAYPFLSSDE